MRQFCPSLNNEGWKTVYFTRHHKTLLRSVRILTVISFSLAVIILRLAVILFF